jgi:short-subunit dehydrogenase
MASVDSTFQAKYGPWAVIAGASVGLGAEFARQLAAKGLNLVLVARRVGPLEERARVLTETYGIEVRTVPLDLASADLQSALCERIRDLDVGLLVYNAALELIGSFLEQDLADKLRIIDVNCRGPLLLAHEFGQSMAARGRGGILLMSSMGGFQVLSFCAGATRTPNFEESQPKKTGLFEAPVMEPEAVVYEALAALGTRPSAVAGRANRIAGVLMSRLLPRRIAVRIISRQVRAMYS